MQTVSSYGVEVRKQNIPIRQTLGRIRKFQREHGSAQSRGRWAYTKRLNIELGKKIAGAIIRYAEENHADVIVFEYLEMQGKISGKKKQKLHLWRKRDIQKRCEHQAHRKGMRVSRVCAWDTSRLAYDGSGRVPVTRKTTASVYSRPEKDITVICQHCIISGQDILSENF